MYYARIKNGIVVATCYFTDATLVDAFSDGYDALIQLGDNSNGVRPGDSFDVTTNKFTPKGD